jgi:uncharacterized membrane protein
LLIRVPALATLGVLVVYHVLRLVASACNGAACEVYIPLSLLFPVLVWIGAALTGVLATLSARRERVWPAVLIVCAAVSVAGPIAALVILRDSPDVFVVSSTVFLWVAPAGALIYSFSRGSMTRR